MVITITLHLAYMNATLVQAKLCGGAYISMFENYTHIEHLSLVANVLLFAGRIVYFRCVKIWQSCVSKKFGTCVTV